MNKIVWIGMNQVKAGLLLSGAVAACAAIWVAKPAVINGKTYANAIVSQGGKNYVSTDALKAAGAQVSVVNGNINVNFVPLGGRNQVDAIEGSISEWMQNDTWRIRVESVEPGSNPFGRGPGYVAKIELRNLSTKAIAPFASGMDKLHIVDADNQTVSFNQASFKSFFQAIAPGGSAVETIAFGDPTNKITILQEPQKLMIFFRATGGKKSKDFRVFLDVK